MKIEKSQYDIQQAIKVATDRFNTSPKTPLTICVDAEDSLHILTLGTAIGSGKRILEIIRNPIR